MSERKAAAAELELRDPLAELLGARAPGETFRYRYEDAVRLSGHSCPTVAGAWLITAAALAALYPGATPVRGDLGVVVGGEAADGSSGPMAQVIAMVTGAAAETGFGGLMGRYQRRDLLRFDPALKGRVRFRRLDSGAEVELRYDPSAVPASPEMGPLLARTLSGKASPEEGRRFAALWQERVLDLLTGDPERVLRLTRLS